jgi:nickel transport protein
MKMMEVPEGQCDRCPERFLVTGFSFVLATVLLYCAVSSASAHGTVGRRIEKRTVCVFFSYDDGEPMAYSKVTVNVPESELPFQSGATDRNGVVCFAPDKAGTWRVTAGDGMGHQQTVSIVITEEGESTSTATQAADTAVGHGCGSGILAGLGIIFGCAGTVAWYRSRKRESSESKGR